MSMNLSGIVIQGNLKNQENQISDILGLSLTFEKEIDFEMASSNHQEEGILDIYFGDKGTLIFAHQDLCSGETYGLDQRRILSFSISETAMAFYFAYSVNNRTQRTLLEFEGERITDEGEEFDFEENQETSELIWEYISHVLGEDFWEIDESAKAYRYAIVSEAKNETIPTPKDKFDFLIPISTNEFQSNYSQEELLHLWNQMMIYAKTHSLNIFNHPSKFQGNHNIFMVNLLYLKNTISTFPELVKTFQSKIPLDAFNAIGKAYSIDFNEETDRKMKQLVQAIPTIDLHQPQKSTSVDKKWWEFWK